MEVKFTKIVEHISSDEKYLSGEEVTEEQLYQLSDNFFNRTRVLEKGSYRQLDSTNLSPHNDWKRRDTKTIYFSKARIDAFFAKHPTCDGLKIYLGLHDKEIFPAIAHERYNNKMMVVLVATEGEIEKLNADDVVMIAGSKTSGDGMDNGKLCPPHPDCA